MRQRVKYPLILTSLLLAVAAGLAAGLYYGPLSAQEDPPQVGHGALQRVEIISSDKCNATLRVFRAANDTTNNEVAISLPPGQCNRTTGEELAAQATTFLQDELDTCQLLTDLPEDDPDKTIDPITTNPEQKSLRWILKPDGFTYLCSSPVTVTVTWNGTEYNLEWRSTNAG